MVERLKGSKSGAVRVLISLLVIVFFLSPAAASESITEVYDATEEPYLTERERFSINKEKEQRPGLRVTQAPQDYQEIAGIERIPASGRAKFYILYHCFKVFD